MGGVVYFEIYADDTERAKAFYNTLFGWTYSKMPDMEMDYWLIDVGDQSQGGAITKRTQPVAPEGSSPSTFISTVGVESVNAAIETAVKAGGKVTMPKMGIAGMGWAAYLTDTEGNGFGVFENDPAATWVEPGQALPADC